MSSSSGSEAAASAKLPGRAVAVERDLEALIEHNLDTVRDNRVPDDSQTLNQPVDWLEPLLSVERHRGGH